MCTCMGLCRLCFYLRVHVGYGFTDMGPGRVCACVSMLPSGLLMLPLQAVMNYLMWLLGIKLRSSVRAAHALRAVLLPPAPVLFLRYNLSLVRRLIERI